ncbi:MAG: ROK family protein [Candidatus Zixiibacteriota bacterium]
MGTKKYAVGVDLGATNVRAVLGDEGGHLRKRVIEETERKKGPEGIIQQLIRMIRSVTSNLDPEKIKGVGVASAGTLDPSRRTIVIFANLPFNNIPIVESLEGELKMPIHLLNDCSTAVVGEKMFGAGKEAQNLVYVTISTGIGGGVYVDNRLLFGKDGNAHEIGHMTIDMKGRLLCGCGKKGHWEAYCSGGNIPNYVHLILSEKSLGEKKDSLLFELAGDDLQNLNAKILYNAAKAGDQLSRELVDEIGRANAVGFANIVNLYDPEIITVGGTVALKNVDLVIKPIQKYLGDYVLNRVPVIRITPLGGDVVLYGALAIVFQGIT